MLNVVTYSPESSGTKTYWEEDWTNMRVKMYRQNAIVFDIGIPAGAHAVLPNYGCFANGHGNYAKYNAERHHEMWSNGPIKRYAVKYTECPGYTASNSGGGGNTGGNTGGVGGGTGGGSTVGSGGGDSNIACMRLRNRPQNSPRTRRGAPRGALNIRIRWRRF